MDDTTRVESTRGKSLRKVFLWSFGVVVLLAVVGCAVWFLIIWLTHLGRITRGIENK